MLCAITSPASIRWPGAGTVAPGPRLGTLQPLGSDVDSLVGEQESLRVALEETSGEAPPGSMGRPARVPCPACKRGGAPSVPGGSA